MYFEVKLWIIVRDVETMYEVNDELLCELTAFG